MFKQVFRLTFITFVWKQYKRAIVSTLLLFAYLWLVGKVHTDYLDYARMEANSAIGKSFLIKWAALLAGTFIYLLYHFIARKQKPVKKNQQMTILQDDSTDPFAEIRQRKKLRSRAEMLIEEETQKK